MTCAQKRCKTFRMRDRDDPTPASASHATGITCSVLGGTHGLMMLCAPHAYAPRWRAAPFLWLVAGVQLVRRGVPRGVHPQWQLLLLLLLGRLACPTAGADHRHQGRGPHGQGAHWLDDFDRLAACGARCSTRVQTNQFATTAGGWRLSDAANGPADEAFQVALLGCEWY